MMALIALIIGIAGVPVAILTAGCSSIMNLVGIFLAWMGLKSERRGMADSRTGVKYWIDPGRDHSIRTLCRPPHLRDYQRELVIPLSVRK